jgi:glycosyltransferase involved in cell wall biosynthesis
MMVETLHAPHGTHLIPHPRKLHIPRFSVITPTLMRDSLAKCCESVDRQTLTRGWEHIVIVDLPMDEIDQYQIAELTHPRRRFLYCGKRHRDGGNSCRHEAWKHARGTMAYFLDDDNFIASDDSLERIWRKLETNNFPSVAFFPINRLGGRFFPDGAPRDCHVDTANLVVKREFGQWPATDAYGSDWVMIESLIAKHPYAMFPDEAPIAVVPVINGGR